MSFSRRSLLSALGVAAAAMPSLAATPAEPKESKGHFTHPAEYLAAMQAIGWRPLAMYQRLEGGGVHCMGVAEYGGNEVSILKTWDKFHAISMRAPTQRPADLPQGDWWKWVWRYLYDKELREDVTPPKLAARLDGMEVA